MDNVSEQQLLSRCRRDEPAAWDELFDRHYDAVCRFVFQLAPDFDREDTEEVSQEAFITVVRNLGSFRGGCAFQTWLFRIASNKAKDLRERRRAAKRGGGQVPISLQAEDPETGLTLDPASPAAGPDESLFSAEVMTLLHQALAQLGGSCQEIIELRYFGDLSYEELSTALELNPKTVSSRLSKCLDRLEAIAKALFSGENSGPVSV
ncbi:MAG: RNA polymerase sigma factor [Limisphaerales bacterium]